jgi:CSLREA domain-containing protein
MLEGIIQARIGIRRASIDRFTFHRSGAPTRVIRFLLVPLLAVAFGGWFPTLVQASTFTVNSTADAVDANPGDGICATFGGVCTLRAAIMEANALPGADSLILPAGTFLLTLIGADEDNAAAGDLDITDDLTINGAGSASTLIDANAINRVFQVIGPPSVPINVTLNGVTIQNGRALTGNHGGGFYVSGANFSLSNSAVRNCSAPLDGGGIYITQSLNASIAIFKTVFDTNSASGDGGALYNEDGFVDLELVTFNGNTATNGGGFFQQAAGDSTIRACTFSANRAMGVGVIGGGGIFNNGFLGIETSTLSANSSVGHGGGLLNDTQGLLDIRNGTFSANSADGTSGLGGGLYNLNTSQNQNALTHVTLNLNTASSGGGVANAGDLTLQSTIVASSTAGFNCAVSGAGVITSFGTNLDTDGSCNLNQPGDLPNTAPLLGALAFNGGPTRTHALQTGSPAIDAAQATLLVTTDQRLFPRTGLFDIGAYEFGAAGSGSPFSVYLPLIITN